MKRNRLWSWVFTIGAFIAAFYAYTLFSYIGVKDFIREGVLTEYFDTNVWHLEIIIGGILFGTLFILINQLSEKPILRKRSFGFNIVFKSTLYLLTLWAVGAVIYHLFLALNLVSTSQMEAFTEVLSFHSFLSIGLYYVLFIILMNFLFYINKKFGPGFLLDILRGKYYHPRNEELIFLFLDLKGSTKLAEKLGPNNYSRFIKECIHELTPVIQKYNARVYQYVGDEVILLWKINSGLSNMNCLNTFFDFTTQLHKREKHFISRYGEVPTYKAGMDAGEVTITEIGDIKREIAFHGDVLNTAARLEKKCNEFESQLIASQHIVDRINGDSNFRFKFLSDLPLRGKSLNIKFYSVEA